ncbi:methyltransferase domain-containing protein [Streptomyces chilikensis]|uniref:methyltransferase domain-containing protein n=1 Tax=Streptomyces chilikensis TaxID=1194079 RepID=UPI0014092E94|nr:methyltransferase domain-containing protein [Streptomyces chilikensis]
MGMDWDAGRYLRHADDRARPFADLLARVPALPARAPRIADLGCGPGNATAGLLVRRWPAARITGFDNSPGMLERAAALAGPTEGGGSLSFAHADLTGWTPDGAYDLIVSNAALHWVRGHAQALPGWADALPAGGVLAFQVPYNLDAPVHALMRETAAGPRWAGRLRGVLRGADSVCAPQAYLELFARRGFAVDVWETTYLHVLSGEDAVLDWVSGTGLRPVLAALAPDPGARDAFVAEYGARLREAYPRAPYGTVLPFRRLFCVAVAPARGR